MGSTLDLQVLSLVLFCVSACLSKLLFLDWFAQRPLKQQGERGLRASAWAPGPQGPGRMAARLRCSLGRRELLMGSMGPLPSFLDTAAFPGLSGRVAQFSELVMESSPYGLSEAAASPEVQRLDPAAGVPPHLPDAPALSLGRCPCGLTAQSFR